MDTPTNTSRSPRIRQILGVMAIAVGVAGICALDQLRRHRKTQALLDTLPPTTDAGIQDNTAEPADDVYDPAEVTDAHGAATPLEDLRFDELYQRAQHQDIVGRSSMRKSELIVALRDIENT